MSKVDSPWYHADQIFFFFFQPLFSADLLIFCHHPFCVWSDLHSTQSCSPHTLPPHTKFWGSVPHIPTPPSCTTHCPICDPNPLQNLFNTRDFFFFCFVLGSPLPIVGSQQPHCTRANVWQVAHQPLSPPALYFLSDLLLLP